MDSHKIPPKSFLFLLLLAGLFIGIKLSGANELLSFENLAKHREIFRSYVGAHYLRSVLFYILFFITTAFFMPGALVLTIFGGFLFGGLGGALYTFLGSLVGASLAFVCARHSIGKWLQRRYEVPLKRFNKEMAKKGPGFLVLLRIVPLFPFFIVNYFAGMTRISFRTFFMTTAVGILPGAFVYAFTGHALGNLRSRADIYSADVFTALLAVSAFALIAAAFIFGKKKQSEY